jgi:ParB family chromosome partitioning protein
MADDSRRRLGRGLATLLGDAATDVAPARARGPRRTPIEFLRPNPRNPRTQFREAELAELTASIREKGIIQPILVRSVVGVDNVYEIIAGERRWRAAQAAGLIDVPVVVQEADDKEALELAIIENVQRADLNAIEEAKGYERLAAEFGYSQSEIAKIIGKSRAHVANTLRLLNLPEATRKLLGEGAISAGHGRALLAVDHPDVVARRIVEEGLTVRDVEALGRESGDKAPGGIETKAAKSSSKPPAGTDADTRAMEKLLSDALGMRVSIRHRGEGGDISVRYETLDQLDALCQLLSA